MLTALALLAIRGKVLSFVPELPKTVVYEVNLRALGPHPGFQALTARLPAIRALGTNILWLMPIQPVGKIRSAGGLGSPYSLQNFTAINPEFGNGQDLKAVVKRAHQLKMAVILDWVGDHTSWDSPWIARHPDWYLHDKQGAITVPPGTGWNDVAALDYASKPMRREMIDEMRFWIDRYDLDGFRCDAADRLPIDFWKAAISTLRSSTPKRLLMLAEGHRPENYAVGFNLTYGWDFSYRLKETFQGKDATRIGPAYQGELKGLAPRQGRLDFITNHDFSAWDGSLVEFYKSDEGAHTAFTIAALYGGVPLVYTGQEVDFDKRIPIFDDTTIDWSKDPATAVWMAHLLALKTTHPAFMTAEVKDRSTKDVVVFSKSHGADRALVIANVRNKEEIAPIASEWQGTWQEALTGKAIHLNATVQLSSFGCLVLERRN